MTFKHQAAALALGAAALVPASALAQAAGSNYVSISQVPSTQIYAPGTANATLSTITLSGTRPGTVGIASVPVTISGTNGASAAGLSGCQLVNGSGTVLNTGANAFGTMSAGSNTFTFDLPFSLTQGSPQSLTLRCSIASTAPAGAAYTATFGSPALTPELTANLTSFPSVYPGEVNAPIAAVTLNPGASGSNLSVSSIPLAVTYSGGLTTSALSNCRLANAAGTVLDSTGAGVLNGGINTLSFDNALALTGGAAATPLILRCTVSSAAPMNGSLTLSLAPAGILATNPLTGATVTPTQGYDPVTGSPGTLSGTTYVGANTGTGGVTPPNTGAGAGAPLALAAPILATLAAAGSARILLSSR
jgi:hypothetical protein